MACRNDISSTKAKALPHGNQSSLQNYENENSEEELTDDLDARLQLIAGASATVNEDEINASETTGFSRKNGERLYWHHASIRTLR